MNTPGSRLSEADAHQELMLMDSRVAGMTAEHFLDRLRRLNLPYADVLARFQDVLAETRLCGGRVVHLGKIIGNEMLEFMESDPDLPAGVQLESALRSLGQLAPFLGLTLAPLSAEVESEGFGNLFAQSGYREQMERRAMIFFRRLAVILNLTKNLLSAGQSSVSLDQVSFEEPTLFELDTSENPFDLDDLSTIAAANLAVIKLLVKISLADGNFGEEEKILISQTLEHMGESISDSQFERLTAHASQESVETILAAVRHESVVFKEKLLLLAMVLTAADGRVDTIEKKLLAQAAPLLGVSRQRFADIAKDAVALIKTRKASLVQSAKPIAQSLTRAPASPAAVDQARTTHGMEPRREDSPMTAPGLGNVPLVRDPARREAGPVSRPEPETSPHASRGPVPSKPKAAVEPLPPSPPKSQKIWRCPACHMPQFQEFDECPQCGIIVAKFKEKHARHWYAPDEDVMIDVPDEPVQEPHTMQARQELAEKSAPAASLCASCGVVLPATAKFCPSCGMRVA